MGMTFSFNQQSIYMDINDILSAKTNYVTIVIKTIASMAIFFGVIVGAFLFHWIILERPIGLQEDAVMVFPMFTLFLIPYLFVLLFLGIPFVLALRKSNFELVKTNFVVLFLSSIIITSLILFR